MKTTLLAAAMMLLTMTSAKAETSKPAKVTWDRHSLIIDGRRVMPVMGEVHYSRIPANEWKDEIRKIKEGGVTIIATYVFWNHVEEQQGIFNWSGQRDLRRFLELCKEQNMPVVLRVGPFCHGEARNGGIPDWMYGASPNPSKETASPNPSKGGEMKPMKLRSTDPRFLSYVEKLYRQIFAQVQGLQWKDGGPIIACQFDNEYRGSGDYLMALKKIATDIGFDLPFYTRTGWPALSKPVPFGEMLPLYGDYADGFWDKETKETVGNYYKAFNFKGFRSSTAIGTDLLGKQKAELGKGDEDYPYFTCELGGGMATAYHRRPFIYADDAYSMAVVKLGSGSNLLGYYMYHGGTNPESMTGITLNETQRTLGTANNDLPVKTYDFQCPLGEFGQTYPVYYRLRPLHLFMQDYAEILAPMEASFPCEQDIKKGDDSHLRWSFRASPSPSKGTASPNPSEGGEPCGFIFINNYERLQSLSAKKGVSLAVYDVALPRLTVPSGCIAIFPLNIDGIRFATAQLVANRDGKIYMMQIPGIPTNIEMQDGKKLKNAKPKGTAKPIYKNIYLLTQQDAEHLFLSEECGVKSNESLPIIYNKVKEAGPLRTIVKGKARVAEAPSEEDWNNAAVYNINLPKDSSLFTLHSSLLTISYRGDCARLYANGKLVADNFYYGRPFLFDINRLTTGSQLQLRILPLQPDAPIYLPREADKTAGEAVMSIKLTKKK